MSTSVPPYAVKIGDRLPSDGPWFSYVLFPIVFNIGIISINLTQLIFWPLSLFGPTQPFYTALLLYTKDAFVRLLILMSVLFGPTKLILTAGEGVDLDRLAERDPATGEVVALNLPKRLVILGNHQAYSDWMYLWILAYFARASDGIYILLKKSLKWIPLIGWGMQLYDFIFLSRSWAVDQRPLSIHLKRLARLAVETSQPVWIMIFPEGTIGSDDERPKSQKWAAREGIADLKNMLLPRALGLYTILTTLLPSLPASFPGSATSSPTATAPAGRLPLLDCTIGYPGVPPAGYAQEYYNLFSIFHRSVPPPAVHIHLRMYDAGDVLARTAVPPKGSSDDAVAVGAGDEAEAGRRRRFGEWLTGVWREKDALLDDFYRDGSFRGEDGQAPCVEVEVGWRKGGGWTDVGGAVCWLTPVWIGAGVWLVRRWVGV